MDRDDARPLALPVALLAFGLASAAFDVGCVWIKTPFLRPGVTAGDAIEIAGVFVALALFARVTRLAGGRARVAGLAAIAFALGHGIHVAANSIHDLADRSGAGDPTGLLDFWDERAGHWLTESGRVLFAAALFAKGAVAAKAGAGGNGPANSGVRVGSPGMPLAAFGGLAYGFTTFASAVEGQTVPLVLPFYGILAAALVARRGRGAPSVLQFLAAAASLALLLFAVWGLRNGGFPEFTRTGILPSAGGAHP